MNNDTEVNKDTEQKPIVINEYDLFAYLNSTNANDFKLEYNIDSFKDNYDVMTGLTEEELNLYFNPIEM